VRIAVLGSGPVGRAIAGRLAGLDHQVVMGTRDPEVTGSRSDTAAWLTENPDVVLATFAEAAGHADLVVNAAGGAVSIEVLDQAGEANLTDKVLLDISNPLEPDSGMPPRLFVKDDDSLAEQIQRRFPATRVVKSLNTLNNRLMIDPGALGETTSVFVSSDDDAAKAMVTILLAQLGHGDVIDLGDLSTARGAEMYVAFWVRVALAVGTSDFNIKIVRA
jgi:8-hydroxy-5-deazaflavin:NADPH oxidoreductase